MSSIQDNTVFTVSTNSFPRKKRPLLLIFIILLIIVILGIGSVVAYAKFDVFKSPKTIYLQSELTSLSSSASSLSFLKDQLKSEVTPLLDKPQHYTFDLSKLSLDLDQQDEQQQALLDLIKKTSLVFDIQQDGSTSTSLSKLKLNVDKKSILTFETAYDKNQLSIHVPEVFKKYGYVNFKDMKTLENDLNLNNMPKKIVTTKDIVDAISIKPKELADVLIPYAKLYADSIQPEQVTINKDSVMVEGNTSIPAREITVTLTQNDLTRMSNSFLSKMLEDTVLQDLIYTRTKNVIQLINDSGYSIEEISKADFQKSWKQWIVDAKDSIEKNSLVNGATMILYIDGNHRIIERKLAFKTKDDKDITSAVDLRIGSWTDKSSLDNSLFFINVKDSDGETDEIKLVNNSNVNEKGGKGTLSLTLKTDGSDDADFDFNAVVDYDLIKGKTEDSGTYSFKLDGLGSSEVASSVKGSISITTTRTGDTSESNYDVNLNFKDIVDESPLNSVEFKLHTKQEPIKEVKLPGMTASNSVDMVNMTEDERNQALEELSEGIQAFVDKNSELMNSLGNPF